MTLAEFFSFLYFGKYAFYIWSSYLIVIIVIAMLFIRTAFVHKNTIAQLRAKYLVEDDKTTK